ncbi:hypothetical protein K4K52_010315 [Colletotrichum sp. SAR 10_76]|nr:hypothetical protein K4K52_010315 [Colletotrichum sp. SAR 10_76]
MGLRNKVPAGPYTPETHPQTRMPSLQVGSLYIMISVPLPVYLGRQKHSYPTAVPSSPGFPHSTYELDVTSGAYPEEFHWDLYLHTSSTPDGGSGIIYRLRNTGTRPPTYEYDRIPTFRVLTHAQLVGLVRVVSVPRSVVPHLTRYLEWMTEDTAKIAQRSFVWATMAYYRTRLHLAKAMGIRDHTFNQFDISRFTSELLSFAYGEVPGVLLGAETGPRPVIDSWMGAAIEFLEDDDVLATRRKRDELMRLQKERFGAVSACWYQ